MFQDNNTHGIGHINQDSNTKTKLALDSNIYNELKNKKILELFNDNIIKTKIKLIQTTCSFKYLGNAIAGISFYF